MDPVSIWIGANWLMRKIRGAEPKNGVTMSPEEYAKIMKEHGFTVETQKDEQPASEQNAKPPLLRFFRRP